MNLLYLWKMEMWQQLLDMQEIFGNYSEIIWNGAEGKVVDIDPAGKWGVEVILKSAWAENNWQPVTFPEKYENQIKLYNAVNVDGQWYSVTQNEEMQEVGAVVGWGNTLEEAMALEMRLVAGVSASEDTREGVAAFIEKRAPVWQDR